VKAVQSAVAYFLLVYYAMLPVFAAMPLLAYRK